MMIQNDENIIRLQMIVVSMMMKMLISTTTFMVYPMFIEPTIT